MVCVMKACKMYCNSFFVLSSKGVSLIYIYNITGDYWYCNWQHPNFKVVCKLEELGSIKTRIFSLTNFSSYIKFSLLFK